MKRKVMPTGFWTFFCNPKFWDIQIFLLTCPAEKESSYLIASWQQQYFKPGQLAVIRVGYDQRTKSELAGRPRLSRGVYAVVEIISSPEKEAQFVLDKSSIVRYSVRIKYLRNYIQNPILLDILADDATIIADRYFLRGYQAASMPLKEDAFNRILLYGES